MAQTTTLNGASAGAATATCPQGEVALGGGWSVPPAGARVFAASLNGATWAVSALPLGNPATTAVTAYVECLRDAPGAVVTQRAVASSAQPSSLAVVSAFCNVGETPVGFGFDLSAARATLELQAANPETFEFAVWWNFWVRNRDPVGHAITAYMECLGNVSVAPSYPGKDGSFIFAGMTSSVVAPCPAATVMAGGGLDYKGGTIELVGNLYLLHATSVGWQGAIYGVTGYGLYALVPTAWAVCLSFA